MLTKDGRRVECIECGWVGVWEKCIFAEINYEYENGEKEKVVTSSCPECGKLIMEEPVEEDFDFDLECPGL